MAKAEVVERGAGEVPAPSRRMASAERLEVQGEAGEVAELVVVEPGAASGNGSSDAATPIVDHKRPFLICLDIAILLDALKI